MANKPIIMNKVRQIIRLYSEGKNKSEISKLASVSRNTVKRYLKIFNGKQLTQQLVEAMNNHQLATIFFVEEHSRPTEKVKQLQALLPWIEKELKRRSMTNTLVWKQYIEKHPDGLRFTQFSNYINRWLSKSRPSMHIEHKAGDKLFIDFTGQKLHIVNEQTGEQTEVEVFAAILGCSQLTYVEAVLSQAKEDFISACENALHYFGGAPAAIVPDNLKSAVTKSSKYEPTLNDTFEDFAEHYNTAVVPARSYRPRDKALVEGIVKIIYRRIYTTVDRKHFFSLEELNSAIKLELEVHNNTPLTGRMQSRREQFEEIERGELRPLPRYRYLLRKQRIATVMKNGYALLKEDTHYYSVPYLHIGKKVKLLFSESEVDIYLKYEKICTHKRDYRPHGYTTVTAHLSSAHRFVSEWTADKFISDGNEIDNAVGIYLKGIIESKPHPEQAYKSCSGILHLQRKVGSARLINACKRGNEFKAYGYHHLTNILERNLDKMEYEPETTLTTGDHANIRGSDYYK